jgi:hypothetical protein
LKGKENCIETSLSELRNSKKNSKQENIVFDLLKEQ